MTSRDTAESVLVVGAGAMGTQIAAVFARAGHRVTVCDVTPDALGRSRTEATTRLTRLGEKGAMTAAEAASSIERLAWTTDLEAAATAAGFVIEAATERLELKQDIFGRLGRHTPSTTILATNSSTIPSSRIAEASGRPDRVCNVHFFNPALVMEAVEVVPNPETSDETIATVLALIKGIGKSAVTLSIEVPGFVANRLMTAVNDEAIRLYSQGVATPADIDLAARLALGHPLGPFALMDLVGLDVIYLMHQATYEMTGDPADLPPEALNDLYRAGRLGRKSGRGWFDYTS
ncbi:3-hydroxyacyl-CoA dehydrogenase family protein [Herbiconiux daphne]|uniref:3-hydroxyacyl-CoA dehydrogenase family protein n=1 Tax=Herbiconiux daphne TaxID=2970914 RepID=A0ABT2H762_9MICO|nr:3-hydroxyacyl-CoA dehydrogenase family protein [Herbiconiux daphne]MCS5735753.1 3-hydroxyacyl-CoA dehydrogenase family protein [Herbiconiux daphne]